MSIGFHFVVAENPSKSAIPGRIDPRDGIAAIRPATIGIVESSLIFNLDLDLDLDIDLDLGNDISNARYFAVIYVTVLA